MKKRAWGLKVFMEVDEGKMMRVWGEGGWPKIARESGGDSVSFVIFKKCVI